MKAVLNFIIAMGGIIGVFSMFFYAYWHIYTLVSVIGKPKKIPCSKHKHEYGYIICARNEENVIAELIRSIFEQNYPKEKMHVFVMADNCTDNTAEIARKSGAIVYERFDKKNVGKGYAMKAIFEHLMKNETALKCNGFFVFDADNILSPDYTSAMNNAVDNGARIVVGFRDTKNWNDNWIAACNGLYFIRDSYQMNRSRAILGAEPLVTGTGWYVSKDIILEENGWNYTLMCEDTQFSISQIFKGEHITFCENAVFYDEQVTSWSQSWKQRSRWIKGSLQIIDSYGIELIKRMFSKSFLTYFDCFCMFFGVGYFAAVGMVITILSAIALILSLAPNPMAWAVPITLLFSFYINFFLISVVPLFFARKKVNLPINKKIRYMLIFPFFMMSYMPIAIYVIIKRKKIKWEPIAHKALFEKTDD